VGAKFVGHSGTALGVQSRRAPLLQLLSRFRKARVPFQIIGMGAAVLQGVPVVTQDLDLWVGRPLNRHDEILLICNQLGSDIIDDFKIALPDSSVVNFRYHVDGLCSFEHELKSCKRMRFFGQILPVLSLERICASKTAANRPKDRMHLFYLRQAIRLQAKLAEKRP
jgi:hypothetical protein